MTPTEKMLLIHNSMIEKYKSNKDLYNFIKKFFTLKNGYRPTVIHKRYPINRPPIRYFPAESKRMLQFNEIDINVLYKFIGQLHFLECIFDERIKDENFLKNKINEADELILKGELEKRYKLMYIFNSFIIGISPCIEIDFHIDGLTIFDKYKEAMCLKNIIENKIEENGLKYNSLFSGNGFYTIVESCYFEDYKTDFESVVKNFDILEKKINREMKKEFRQKKKKDKVLIPLIDKNNPRTWNVYKKAPFTYHNKYNRVSIPIPNGEIDKEYLNEMSDFDKFIKSDTDVIKNIICKAGWKEIW